MNLMKNNPRYFDAAENRTRFCRAHGFFPVFDTTSQPSPDRTAYPYTQFVMTAIYKPLEWEYITTGQKEMKRLSESLLPTAFVYECDSSSLKEQAANIKKEALKHILSITFSGSKSLHVLVPIHRRYQSTLAKPSTIFKSVWYKVAERIFNDVSILDPACATIGRLTRMPGAPRLNRDANGRLVKNGTNCPKQTCFYYNPDYVPLDITAEIESAAVNEMRNATNSSICAVFQKYGTLRSLGDANGEDELVHLKRSFNKYPSPNKKVAVDVLVNGVIPSSNDLPSGSSYMATIQLLRCKFPTLLRAFVERVKMAHPTCLPKPVEAYLTSSPSGSVYGGTNGDVKCVTGGNATTQLDTL